MANFLDSLSIGMQIAQNRHQNFVEIHNIFLDFKSQLENFSNNKLLIELYGQNGDYFTDTDSSIIYQDKKLFACLAENPDQIFVELTAVKFAKDGYPCTIFIEGNTFDSFDKSGLEKSLKNLLESPDTGQKIFSLLTK